MGCRSRTSSTSSRGCARRGSWRAAAARAAATCSPAPPTRSRWPRSSRRSRAPSPRSSASPPTPTARSSVRAKPSPGTAARPSCCGPACASRSCARCRIPRFPNSFPRRGLPLADLEIRNLHMRVEDREILKGVDLSVNKGELHALMGPNGSGKSTLASTIMGHPEYEITEGSVHFKGTDITEADPEDRAHAGLFLAFQYPVAIPGVSIANFLRMAINTGRKDDPINVKEFRTKLQHAIELLDVDRSFTSRHLNDGFSGGEKKRAEILQMAMLEPEIAVLDETDSGLDIDALRTVAEGVAKLHAEQGMGALIITHYQRILHYVKPEFVHVMMDGRIVMEGGTELVERLEREGYEPIREEVGARA